MSRPERVVFNDPLRLAVRPARPQRPVHFEMCGVDPVSAGVEDGDVSLKRGGRAGALVPMGIVPGHVLPGGA